MTDPHNIPPQVIEAIQRGNLIEAIKAMRRHRPQLGLAEAKALIEAVQKQGGVSPLVQKAHEKVAKAAAQAHGTATLHAHHAPPIATSQMNPDFSPGEVPRSSNGAVFALVVVALLAVVAAAAYFGR